MDTNSLQVEWLGVEHTEKVVQGSSTGSITAGLPLSIQNPVVKGSFAGLSLSVQNPIVKGNFKPTVIVRSRVEVGGKQDVCLIMCYL
jgi:hypothetical protein